MNTSGSKDLTRKYRKKINRRNKKGPGYFYSSHNHNFNRNTGFQASSVGFSEYVLHNPNARSYNARLNPNRTNSGYLKHISSQSIGREKDNSTMGCYEEYTLRKIRTTSDMIKQQLMSPEHQITTSGNETNIDLDNVPPKKNRLSGENSKLISENNKEYSQTKLRRKPSKSSEEVSRLQLKERRKNELREKFKKDNISKQRTSETYNVEEISDKIIKHITKMNNEKLVDFLNSDNSRYEEAFNYICKKKSFELTKALRDLSHQEEPATCEIVNSIIPDFSIKIEELPIDIIRELSSKFDELHKNIEDSCLSEGNLHLLNEYDLKSYDEMYFQSDNAIKKEDLLGNLGTIGNLEQIVVIDSDEENLPLNQDSTTNPLSGQVSDNIEKEMKSLEVIEVELNSASNQIPSLNITNISTDALPTIIPFQHTNEITFHSNLPIISKTLQPTSSITNISPDIGSQRIEENSSHVTISNNSQNTDNSFDEIMKNAADSTDTSLVETMKAEVENDEINPGVTSENNDLDPQPKVGSVWVSRNIFQTTDISKEAENVEFHESNEYHVENSVHTENDNAILNDLIPPPSEENIIATSVESKITQNIFENIDSIQEPEKSCISKSQTCELQNAGPIDDTLKNIVSLSLPSTINDNSQLVLEIDNKNTSENTNSKKQRKKIKNATRRFNKSQKMASIDVPVNQVPQCTSHSDDSSNKIIIDNEIVPTEVYSNPENEFITMTINDFDKPKNLLDAIKFMKAIDQKIEILTKLRQDIIIGLSESVTPSEDIVLGRKKKKLDDSGDGIATKNKCRKTVELSDKTEAQNGKKSPAKIRPFSNLPFIGRVVLFCKIMYDRGEFIVGTADGKIQYYSIYGKKPLMDVDIGDCAISFLECVIINDRSFVCTGNTTELELKILKYKRRVIEQKIYLEDSIQALTNEWGYFFIGGKRGYLTRYDWKNDRIQYEDRISSSCIKALRATREGPRKILVILFEDADGEAHVHVRDAMTALHIRTIVDLKNLRCMYLRYSTLYLVTDGEITVYNCCDGRFVTKIMTNKSFSLMKSKGNLLILGTSDGIYGYNMKTNEYLGCVQGEMPVSTLNFFNNQILCSTWEKKMELLDIAENFREILGRKC